ncbi:hypothetical protein NHX12_030383 [Muraenolepis orangiensis]|uniref:Homeobox domain-containing protein n=1 Tax=Muraenolepis orangiensis TaxID=630683 RepID=A0A9Q0IKZ1_9TELE|nr:hypothetical protein NHX12_030383 [Muraenolepis orangiensis]
MASKRKSTVPCMIPSKSKHMREEIILGCLPDLLPTIPEDSILSISGDGSGHNQPTSTKPPDINRGQKGGAYSCSNCRFESRDLNYFLDHMHNCHIDFRAQPTFYCLNCGVSVVRFEALALHNAKAHRGIMQGSITASLHVNKRDGLTTVEQSLFTDSGEDYRESGLSLTKTPIAKMMRAKGEHKKIVVSHTVEVRKLDPGKDLDLNMLTNVPELPNGALSVSGAPAMARTTVTHAITTASNQVFHQQTPPFYSSHSSSSFKDLPKVLIPLSSIPAYDAAMDTSSFLKTSFGKFPYPTKAELCYLTVVSEFPQEQVKLWFTAQRLKQGISWSPEEIEEARRKMFNTVFQGQPQQKQPVVPQHASHMVSHRTVIGQPAHFGPVGPHYPMPNIPFGNLRNRSTGVITTQANMSTNPKVTRVTYSAPAYPPKFPSVVRKTQVLTKNTHLPPLEPTKSNGLDVAGGSVCVSSTSSSRSSSSSSCSSSSSISSYSSCSNGGETGNRKHVNGSGPPSGAVTCGAVTSPNITNKEEPGSSGKAHVKMNSVTMETEGGASTKSQVIVNSTSINDIACNTHNNNNSTIIQHEQSRVTKPSDDCNNYTNQHTKNGSISDCPSSTGIDGVPSIPSHASNPQSESTTSTTTVIAKSSLDTFPKDFPVKGMSILQQLIKDDPPEQDMRCSELKVDPIKINLKKLKMSEPEPNLDIFAPLTMNPEPFDNPLSQPSFPPLWGAMTPHQVHILRQVFCGTPWPSSQQYEDLSIMTGLPKSEVVRWFSDSRYIHKNNQRKWLESYQRLPTESEEANARREPNGEMLMDPQPARRKSVDPNGHHEGGGVGMNLCQRDVWQDAYSPLLGLMGSAEAGERGRPGTSVQPGVLQDPWLERVTAHQQPMTNPSFMDQQTDTSQARDRLRMELLEV